MTRTRANGQQLSEDGVLADAFALARSTDLDLTHCFELRKDLKALIAQERKAGFDEGFQLGAKVEQGAARGAVASALLDILGKDAGDGEIDLGAAGKWYWAGESGVHGRWIKG